MLIEKLIFNIQLYPTAICNTGALPAGIWKIECHNSFTYTTLSHYRAFSISTGGATTIDATRSFDYSQNSGGHFKYGLVITIVKLIHLYIKHEL